MKRAICIPLLFSITQFSIADNCSERITAERLPIWPRRETPWEVLAGGQACIVFIRYGLSAEGEPLDIEAYTEGHGCEPFESSSIRALEGTTFTKGVIESGCEHRFKYENER